MSKKKRNRRPAAHAPAAQSTPVQGAGTDVIEAEPAAAATPEASAAPGPEVGAMLDAVASRPRETASPASADAPRQPPAPKPRAPQPVAAGSGWVPHESGDIRGVLIQVGGGRLLLPNATIAEVLSYAEPEAGGEAADWLLGRFRWRGWQLPLVAFSRLAGIGDEQPGLGSKVIVLKALGDDRRIPYFAVLTQGFPRLVTVSPTVLEVEDDGGSLPACVQARVRLNDEPALLPDLLQVERSIRELREREAA